MIQTFNNKTQKVWDDLKTNIKKWAKLNNSEGLMNSDSLGLSSNDSCWNCILHNSTYPI